MCPAMQPEGGGVFVSVGFVLVVHKNKNRGTRPVVLISVGATVRAEIGGGSLVYDYQFGWFLVLIKIKTEQED